MPKKSGQYKKLGDVPLIVVKRLLIPLTIAIALLSTSPAVAAKTPPRVGDTS